MTTTQQTPNIKELVKADLIKNKSAAQAKANEFTKKMKFIELEWRKSYIDICKHSPNFELVEKPMSETFRVFVQTFNPDGSYNRNEGMTLVDNIVAEYKTFDIIYTGKLPEGKKAPSVIIDEHITYRKGGHGSTNHGFKMKARINYDDSKFFKSGKKIVEIIGLWVKSEWETYTRKQEGLNLRNLAYKTMVDKYPNSKVSLTEKGEIVVSNQNGSKIIMGYNKKDDQVNYVVFKVEFPKEIKADYIIEKLGNI
jgi:hypothetical protein